MSDLGKFPLKVSPDKALPILKALSNESRLRIMHLLSTQPMGVTEIARTVGLSQPTATVYLQQLEEAGLISHRFQKSPQGVQKLSFNLYDSVQIDWDGGPDAVPTTEYTIDMPVGHYTMIDCRRGSLLASSARILASREDVSKFFNPVRMEAELLVLEEGSVRYLFPYNIPPSHELQGLRISLEVGPSFLEERNGASFEMAVNGRVLGPIVLDKAVDAAQHSSAPEWLSPRLPAFGRLLVLEIDEAETRLNTQLLSDLAVTDLGLVPMRPFELELRVGSAEGSASGLVIYGKGFGLYNQDIRAAILHRGTEVAS